MRETRIELIKTNKSFVFFMRVSVEEGAASLSAHVVLIAEHY